MTKLARFFYGFIFVALVCATVNTVQAEKPDVSPPTVGELAADFQLQAVGQEEPVKLSEQLKQGPVVLIVLRGYPGYQCPLCTRQLGSLMGQADALREQNASVLLVYPGPGADLEKRANEFLKQTRLPAPLTLLLDPDYKFTNAYHLRWDAPRETAYPSTFVIDTAGKIRFAKVSKIHGGRSNVKEVLTALQGLK